MSESSRHRKTGCDRDHTVAFSNCQVYLNLEEGAGRRYAALIRSRMAVGLIHPYNASNGLCYGDSYGEYLWNHSRISSHLGLKAFKTRSRRRSARDEWVRAIDRLNQQIKDWLTDSDPDRRFLEVRELPCQLREQGIGTYEARGLLIRVGRLEVRVEPIARMSRGHIRRQASFTSVEHSGGWI